jgi:D-alanyl-D-alanine carboxypeptidase
MRCSGSGGRSISRAAAGLLAAALLLTACASTANPTGNPSAGEATANPPGPPTLPAASDQASSTRAPGDTLAAGATPDPDATSTPGGSPAETGTPAAGPSPTGTSAGRALPACAYRDIPARGNPDRDWATMVLDTIYRLPADFAPKHLVSTAKAGMNGGLEVIPAVIDDLRDMHAASARDGEEIAVRWAYRSYAEQAGAFAYWVRTSGRQEALRLSARPGHSEHQLGTTIDFRSADSFRPPWDYPDWGTTGPGIWMAQNAWRYGFVLSYPKGQQSETCYGYEPWHYRYVGRDLARDVHGSGQTLRRYLWDHASRPAQIP